MNILSLFSNVGVAEAYLEEDGFNVVVANELDPKRANLYQQIYPKTKMICGDIKDDDVYKAIINSSINSKVDIVMATPPCQGMSTAGKLLQYDERNNLFNYALNIIEEIQPKYFIFENVPAFMSTYVIYNEQPTLIPDVIIDRMSKMYDMSFQIINAQNYGVPQMRERLILLASNKSVKKKWSMPKPSDKIVTMEDAIGWIPIIDPFVKDISEEEFKKMFPLYEDRKKAALKISKWNIPPKHVYRNVIAMQHTPTGKSAFDNNFYKPKKRDGSIVRGFKNTYKRQNWNTPAYTIAMDNIEISSQNNVHPGRYIGKDENGDEVYSDARALTLYELMKLMSIPDNWPIPSNTNPAYLRKMIGEGIPSLLVRKIFNQIK